MLAKKVEKSEGRERPEAKGPRASKKEQEGGPLSVAVSTQRDRVEAVGRVQ